MSLLGCPRATKEAIEKVIADQKALDDKKTSDKAAATTKLKALGLTDDEIAALSS